MNARTLPIVSLAIAATLGACSSHEPETASADLTPVSVHITRAETTSDQKPIEVYGIVQPARQSFISGRVVGPVIAVKVVAGDVVRKGQTLVQIQPQMIDGQVSQAEGALAQASAALALAEKNYKRFENLHAQKAASDLELDMARMQYEQAKGAVQQAKGAVQTASAVADDAEVRAPFSARVVEKLVEVGDLAAPGRPLVRLESLSGRKIWLTIREADINRISEDQVLQVRFDTRPGLGLVEGIVDEIVPAADPATHTFTVKVSLRDVVDVPSGISGRALLPGNVTERLFVPASAVFRRGGLELIVVRAEDGTARTRAVTTGHETPDGRVEILSGLTAGEEIAVDIAGPVADGTPLEVAS